MRCCKRNKGQVGRWWRWWARKFHYLDLLFSLDVSCDTYAFQRDIATFPYLWVVPWWWRLLYDHAMCHLFRWINHRIFFFFFSLLHYSPATQHKVITISRHIGVGLTLLASPEWDGLVEFERMESSKGGNKESLWSCQKGPTAIMGDTEIGEEEVDKMYVKQTGGLISSFGHMWS